MPQGPLVRELSKKSKSYFLAGGNVRATWPATQLTHKVSKKAARTPTCANLFIFILFFCVELPKIPLS